MFNPILQLKFTTEQFDRLEWNINKSWTEEYKHHEKKRTFKHLYMSTKYYTNKYTHKKIFNVNNLNFLYKWKR